MQISNVPFNCEDASKQTAVVYFNGRRLAVIDVSVCGVWPFIYRMPVTFVEPWQLRQYSALTGARLTSLKLTIRPTAIAVGHGVGGRNPAVYTQGWHIAHQSSDAMVRVCLAGPRYNGPCLQAAYIKVHSLFSRNVRCTTIVRTHAFVGGTGRKGRDRSACVWCWH